MKRILYSSAVLTIFSFSMVLFQISCQDEAEAQNPVDSVYEPQHKFLYTHYNDFTGEYKFFTADIDGTNQQELPITLPTGLKVSDSNVTVTADGQTLIFVAEDENDVNFICSVSIDGTNFKKIVDGTGVTGDGIIYSVQQAY